MLEVKNLKKKYGKNLVLKGIDLKVEKGDRIAIIGPSGCGKSSILNIISNLDKNYKGNINIPNVIFVDRNKTREVDSTIIRNKISKNDDVSEYLSKKVYNYIKENKLYLN